MADRRRGNLTTRDKILEAAAELVGDVGARRLTLDAVAERAGLSKGGLLYNFPSKDALLQGMVERLIGELRAEKEARKQKLQGSPNLEARLNVTAALQVRRGP